MLADRRRAGPLAEDEPDQYKVVRTRSSRVLS